MTTTHQYQKRRGRHGTLRPIAAFSTLVVLTALQVRTSLAPLNVALETSNPWPEGHDVGGSSGESHDERADQERLLRLKNTPRIRGKIINNIAALRQEFEKLCTDMETSRDLDSIEWDLDRELRSFFKPPSALSKLENNDPVQPCMYTFIDLGANIGDSLGKFIDAGFSADCPGLERTRSRAQYDIGQGLMTLGDGNVTDLTDYVKARLDELSRNPEDYCYVGVEGNPVFTATLQELEARVKGTIPKPVRAAHFYTETVAANKDGPTVLYLDTVNVEQNFWGSSMVRTHIDVEKSAVENGDSPVEERVMGVTLSTLLKRSVKRERGAHVIIKIDIEGGEYPVMNEAIDALCDYKSSGVRVDLILETHSDAVLGEPSEELEVFQTTTVRRMKACGIQSGLLSPKWGQ